VLVFGVRRREDEHFSGGNPIKKKHGATWRHLSREGYSVKSVGREAKGTVRVFTRLKEKKGV